MKEQSWDSQFYVRHSWAYAPQNFLLSDIDLTCFVSADNYESFQVAREEVNDFFKKHWLLRWLPVDVDVLPDSCESRRRCEAHYVHRTLYPFRSWMKLGETRHAVDMQPVVPNLPLDYSVENTLECYIQPVIEGIRSGHPLQSFLLARKVNRDVSAFGFEPSKHRALSLAESLHEEVLLWDRFYRRMEFDGSPWDLEVDAPRKHHAAWKNIQTQWGSKPPVMDDWSALTSVWAWPSYFGVEPVWHVSINLDVRASSGEMIAAYRTLSAYFKALFPFCALMVGSEASMVGRLNALSRNLLLDPWLFSKLGNRLYGATDCRESITFPSRSQFTWKLQEYLLYYCSTVLGNAQTDYGFYQLGLAVDSLLRSGRIVMDPAALKADHPRFHIEPDQFDGIDQSQRTLAMLNELHCFSF
ncbi:hypothetical protein N9181_01375 [bacterium]|nr:hypothetical protein [bacterium]